MIWLIPFAVYIAVQFFRATISRMQGDDSITPLLVVLGMVMAAGIVSTLLLDPSEDSFVEGLGWAGVATVVHRVSKVLESWSVRVVDPRLRR